MEGLTEALQQTAMWVWQATWRASVLIGLVLAIRAVLGPRLPPRWLYAMWLVVVVRLLLPFGPASRISLFNLLPHGTVSSVPSGVMSAPPAWTGDQASSRAVPGDRSADALTEGPHAGGAGPTASRASVSWVSILAWVWLAGALALATTIGVRHIQLWRIVRFQRAVTHSAALGALEDCRARMRISTLLGAVLTDQVQSPALFGLVRPRLLIPTRMSRHVSAHDLRHVFLHELAHLRHHDIALGWLTSVCQVLHWFNPLVWLAFHQMRIDRELACDELAMSYMSDPDETRRYGQTLIQLQEVLGPTPPLASLAAVLEGRSQLRTRIRRIVGFGGSRPWQSAVAAVVLVLLAGTGLTDPTSGVADLARVPTGQVAADDTIGEMTQEVPIAAGRTTEPNDSDAEEARGAANQDKTIAEPPPVVQAGAWARDLPSEVQDKVYLYYDLNRVEGKRAVDVLSGVHHGLVHGDPGPGQGIEGGALALDGQDDFLAVEAMPSRAFTVCVWAKPDEPVPGQCRNVLILVSPQAQLEIAIDGLGQVEWRSRTDRGSQSQFRIQVQQTDPEAWSHVGVAWEDGAIRLYLNGASVDGQVIQWNPSTQFLNVGGGSYGSWRGLIDEVVVFTEALAPEQIRQVVALAGPVEAGFSAGRPVQQGLWQQGVVGGFGIVDGRGPYPNASAAQAMARSTLRQLGLCVGMIVDQWAPKVMRGDWRQADDMVTPLRLLLQQLDSASSTGLTMSWPNDGSLPHVLTMAPGSLARAIEVLAGAQAEPVATREKVASMAQQVDSIIRAVASREGDSVWAGCLQLRQLHGQLLADLGLDGDPTFRMDIRPSRPAVMRPPSDRVRVRPSPRRGR